MRATPTILLTRPRAQSLRFADQCRGAIRGDFDILIAPVIRIEPLSGVELPEAEAMIFTSENAVDAVAGKTRPRPVPAFCVGKQTAIAAARAGFVARAAGGNADSLAELIRQAGPQGRLLHPRGEHQTGDLAARLCADGMQATSVVVYRQVGRRLSVAARAVLGRQAPVILPLFSQRSAQAALSQIGVPGAPLHPVAISGRVADRVAALGAYRTVVSERPDAAGMVAAIARLIDA